MNKDDQSFGEYGDQVLDAIVENIEHESNFISPKSNLKPFKDKQIPEKVLKKRIGAELREYQVTAGLTTTQRKILKAKIEAMRTRVYQDKNNFITDAQIARSCKVSASTISLFNENDTCRNALMACTKVYIENTMPDIVANLLNQGKNFYQPNKILLEMIQQYAS